MNVSSMQKAASVLKVIIRISLVALVLTSAPSAALASSDGQLGPTSTGSTNISAIIAARVQISKLSDVSFAAIDPGTSAYRAQNVCVWSNTAGRKYNVTATGSGTSNAFTLSGGALGTVPYAVEWNQSSGQTSGSALTSATALSGQASLATSPTCDFGVPTSASLIVKMTAATLQGMRAGVNYTGTLTLIVAAE